MSKEMDSIRGLKVSDVFDLTKVSFPSSYTDDQVRVAGRAIANYDRMADEIADLKRLNSEFAEFAKRQGWMHASIDEHYKLTESDK